MKVRLMISIFFHIAGMVMVDASILTKEDNYQWQSRF
jgi:hypothetical protein